MKMLGTNLTLMQGGLISIASSDHNIYTLGANDGGKGGQEDPIESHHGLSRCLPDLHL